MDPSELTTQIELRRRRAEDREVHDERLAAQLGVALAVAFGICLVTGVMSHLHQHPVEWLSVPAVPTGLYRFTQGLHVATGLASVPLLLAKLYVVSPNLPRWPPVDDPVDAMARLALLPLVGGSLFLLVSGSANIAHWYPWKFFFPTGHWWAAWLVVGALIVHVALQVPVLRRLWPGWAGAHDDGWVEVLDDSEPAGVAEGDDVAEPDPGADEPERVMSRRGLIALVAGAAGVITVLTAGQTFPPLKRTTALAPRRADIGPQGFPVNRSAAAARTEGLADDPTYRLVVVGPTGEEAEFTIDALRALPQVTKELPISCVEGWSASPTWTGVTMASVLDAADLDADGRDLVVRSAQESGLYASSPVSGSLAARDDCLLALQVGGEPLAADHGAPLRLIAPNRPGVQQTKWVTRVEVA